MSRVDTQNNTPFEALAFHQIHKNGDEMAVLALRGTFHFVPGEPLVLAARPEGLALSDRYQGDPHKTPLIRTCDVVPYKPATDVTLLGHAFAPAGEPSRHWRVGVSLGDLAYEADVHGPRSWVAEGKGTFRMGEAEAVRSVPLAWTEAFGGPIPGTAKEDRPADVVEDNPLGCGVLDDDSPREGESLRAPSLEDPADPILDWKRRDYKPHGFGPVSPWWWSRRQYTGTYDEEWLEKKHPVLPMDFDYRFYQYAPPGLVYPGYARGGEVLELTGIHPDHPVLTARLPDCQPTCVAKWRGGDLDLFPMMLDGVHVDFLSDPARVFLTWRCWVPARGGVRRMDVHVDDAEALIAPLHRLDPRKLVRAALPDPRGGRG